MKRLHIYVMLKIYGSVQTVQFCGSLQQTVDLGQIIFGIFYFKWEPFKIDNVSGSLILAMQVGAIPRKGPCVVAAASIIAAK